jgi:hypothetical protein
MHIIGIDRLPVSCSLQVMKIWGMYCMAARTVASKPRKFAHPRTCEGSAYTKTTEPMNAMTKKASETARTSTASFHVGISVSCSSSTSGEVLRGKKMRKSSILLIVSIYSALNGWSRPT